MLKYASHCKKCRSLCFYFQQLCAHIVRVKRWREAELMRQDRQKLIKEINHSSKYTMVGSNKQKKMGMTSKKLNSGGREFTVSTGNQIFTSCAHLPQLMHTC